MAKVITLDGLKTGTLKHLRSKSLGRVKCKRTVSAYSPTLDREVEICEEDAVRAAKKSGGIRTGKRGRPKGSTVKRGARRPNVKSCSVTKIVKNRRGRKVCRCGDSGNTQILPNSKCGLPKGKSK